MSINRLSISLAAFSITLALAGSAFADDPACQDSATPGTVTVEHTANGRVRYHLPTTTLCGERQAPQAFVLSGRSPLHYTQVEAGEHFVEPIVAAVRRAPF